MLVETPQTRRIKNIICLLFVFIVFFVLPALRDDSLDELSEYVDDPQYRVDDGVEQVTLFPITGSSTRTVYSLIQTGPRKYKVRPGLTDNAVAQGTYVVKSGRKEFHAKKCSGIDAWHACGFLEGLLLKHHIVAALDKLNEIMRNIYGQDVLDKVNQHITSYLTTLEAMVNKIRSGVHDELNDDEVAYWLHVTDVYSQLEGIRDGFNHDNDGINKITLADIFLLNSITDLHSIALSKLPLENRPSLSGLHSDETLTRLLKHATSLGVLAPFAGDSLKQSHPVWITSQFALIDWKATRILKQYEITNGINYETISWAGVIVPPFSFTITQKNGHTLLVSSQPLLCLRSEQFSSVPSSPFETLSAPLSFMRVAAALHSTTQPNRWAELVSSPPGFDKQMLASSCLRHVVSSLSTTTQEDDWFVVEQVPGHIATLNISKQVNEARYFISLGRPLIPSVAIKALGDIPHAQLEDLELFSRKEIATYLETQLLRLAPADPATLLYRSIRGDLIQKVRNNALQHGQPVMRADDVLYLGRIKPHQ